MREGDGVGGVSGVISFGCKRVLEIIGRSVLLVVWFLGEYLVDLLFICLMIFLFVLNSLLLWFF